MADLMDALRTPDPDLSQPPAHEVRRRGDRIRRRRRAVQVGGATVAVALALAVPALLSGVGPRDSAPPVVTTPSPTPTAPTTSLPAGLPLTAGWPDPGGDGSVTTGPHTQAIGDIAYCGRAAYPVSEPAARRTARLQLPAETRSREVTSYAEEADAQDAIQAFVAAVDGCPSSQEGPSVTTYEKRELTSGDESYAVLAAPQEKGAIGVESILLVRVRNVLVVSTWYGEGRAGQVRQRALDDEQQIAPLVRDVARAASAGSDLLGFDGLGDLRLGMNEDDLAATGEITIARPVRDAACDGVVVNRWGPTEGQVDGYLSHRQGLTAISARTRDTVTGEGIRIGSSDAELRAAYPTADNLGRGEVRVTDAGHPGRTLTFTVEGGKVNGFVAALTTQDC